MCMNKIITILEELNPGIDYNKVENLIDGRYLDSLSILSLIAELEEEFDVEIKAIDINPNNFNSAKKIYELINRLLDE